MNRTDTIPLPYKHFGLDSAVDVVSATTGLHADIPHALLITTIEPTKAETTP